MAFDMNDNKKTHSHRQQMKSMGRKRERIWNIFHAWNRYECHFGCVCARVFSFWLHPMKYSTCTDRQYGNASVYFVFESLYLYLYTTVITYRYISVMVWEGRRVGWGSCYELWFIHFYSHYLCEWGLHTRGGSEHFVQCGMMFTRSQQKWFVPLIMSTSIIFYIQPVE